MRILDRNIIILGICTIALVVLSIVILQPAVAGDGVSYVLAIDFLVGKDVAFTAVAHRIITTFGGLWVVIGLSKIFGSVLGVWFAMNTVLYTTVIFVFYKLLTLLFEDKRSALIGTLFLATNYAVLRFGLNFLMDMGGWAFYLFSIYFLLRYSKFGQRKDILLASALVGLGGLFKEYAFLPTIPIAIFLIYESRWSLIKIIKNSWLPSLLAIVPTLLVYSFVYFKFGYSYLDWLQTNEQTYVYQSRIVEYIKSFGSVINLLGILFVAGLVAVYKEWGNLEKRTKLYIVSIGASFLPIFIWPAITQRILFITVPFVTMVATFAFRRYPKYAPVFILALVLYILASFTMDSFLLNFINLPL